MTLTGDEALCAQVSATFASNSASQELCEQLQARIAGAQHLSLHVIDREHGVVLASGNLLRPGLLTSSLHPLAESLSSAAAVAAGPKLWELDGKRTPTPREIATVTSATACSTFATVPLRQAAGGSSSPAPQPVFGFLLAAFTSKATLSRSAVDACVALSQAVSQSCQQQLAQHCRLVVNCLLLANYHGEEAGPAPTGATPGAGSESEDLSEGWDTEDEDSEGGLEGPEEGAGGMPEGRDGADGDSEGEGGSGWAGGGGGGRGGLRRRGFAAGGGGAGDEGPSSSARQDSQRRAGHGMHGGVKLDPFSLTFAMPEVERMFQTYYGSTMLRADMVAFLVHAALLLVGYLSPFAATHLTFKQCCQSLAVVLPLPLLVLPSTRRWYCRHRDTLLWLLRLYTLCYLHIRLGELLSCAAASGIADASGTCQAAAGPAGVTHGCLPPTLPRLAYVYGWLALSSLTWQLRFSHHLPVTLLAHAVNIALLWQGSCPSAAAVAGMRRPPVECTLLGVGLGTAYLVPCILIVYWVEWRARSLFAAFLPFWE